MFQQLEFVSFDLGLLQAKTRELGRAPDQFQKLQPFSSYSMRETHHPPPPRIHTCCTLYWYKFVTVKSMPHHLILPMQIFEWLPFLHPCNMLNAFPIPSKMHLIVPNPVPLKTRHTTRQKKIFHSLSSGPHHSQCTRPQSLSSFQRFLLRESKIMIRPYPFL